MVKLPDKKQAKISKKSARKIITSRPTRRSSRRTTQFVPFSPKNENLKKTPTKLLNGLPNGVPKLSKTKNLSNGLPKPKKIIAKKIGIQKGKVLSKQAKPIKITKKEKSTPKSKNDRLKPRPDITDYRENPFFASKTISDTYVSPSVYAKYAIRAVTKKNIQELKKIVSDKARFPSDGFNQGYSYYDQRCAEMMALLSGDKKFYEDVKKVIKDLRKEQDIWQRPSNQGCLLQKMTTGHKNHYMLGHATANIEMTRGGREGNNALINYDSTSDSDSRLHRYTAAFILETNPDFGFIDHLVNKKDDFCLVQQHEMTENIYQAVRFGHRILAGNMIKAYAQYDFNQLHQKSLLNNKEGLGKFMPISVTKKAQMNKRITPIHTAAINPNPEFLKAMIPFEPNYNHPDMDNWTTIHYASVCEGPGPLKHLLSLETPIILHTKRKETPIHCAARAGRLENLKLLVETLRRKKDGTPAKNKNDEEDENMEEDQPQPKKSKNSKYQPKDMITTQLNAKDFYGFTPLHMAVEHDHLDVVKYLLEQNEINVEIQTSAGSKKVTPLIVACQKGNREMVELLIDHGHAYIEQHDKLRRTPLTHAVIGGHLHIVSLLLRRGASLGNKPDSSGNTAAHYAAAYGWLDILNLLGEADESILGQTNSWHLTPFSVAYLKGHLGIVEHLLNGKHADRVNVNAVDNDGCTLLMLIIKNQDVIGPNKAIKEQIEYLLAKDADASKVDSFNTSALHYFCALNAKLKTTHPDDIDTDKNRQNENKRRLTIKEYEQIVDMLLNAGAKLDEKNEKNLIPVDLALKTGNLILAQYLFKKNPTMGVNFWTNTELESEDRRSNILHSLVDLPFKVQKDSTNWSGVFGPMVEQYDVMPMMTKIFDMVEKEVKIDWIKEYDTQGMTPLHKLCQNIIHFSRTGPTDGENAAKNKRKNDLFIKKAFELLDLLIRIHPEAILLRTKPKAGENFEQIQAHLSYIANFNGQPQRKQHLKRPILLNCFDNSLNSMFLVDEDKGYSYEINGKHYSNRNLLMVKLIEVAKTNGLLKSLLTQRDHRDRTPLLYCIDLNKKDAANLIIYESKEAGIANLVHNAVIRKKLIDGEVDEQGQPKEIDLNKSTLHLALEKSLFDIAENLQLNSKDLGFADANGANAMHYLAKLHSDKISKIFEHYKDAGVPLTNDKHGRYPLHYAVNCCLGQDAADILTEPIEWLLKHDNVGVNAQDEKGRTPLHYAFVPIDKDEKKAQEIVEKIEPVSIVTLLVKGMGENSLKSTDTLGNTALHYAAQRGANICVVTLLRYNIDVNSKNLAGNTPLGLAVMSQHEAVALTLIQAKADISAKVYGDKPDLEKLKFANRWVWSPKRMPTPTQVETTITSLVVKNGWQGIIYMIMDILEKSTDTILYLTMAAIEHKKYNLVQTLLRMLGKVKTGVFTDTIIFTKLAKNNDTMSDTIKNVLRMLFDAGIPWAEKNGRSECIEILSENINFSTMAEIESLDFEFYNGQNWNQMKGSTTALVILKNLIENCSDNMAEKTAEEWKIWLTKVSGWCQGTIEGVPMEFDKPAFDGMQVPMPKQPNFEKQQVTALIRAVQKRSVKLVKYLINEVKVDINATDDQGRTPLMHAIMENAEPIVYKLFDTKFTISEKNQAEQVNIEEIQNDEETSDNEEDEPMDEEEEEEDDDESQPSRKRKSGRNNRDSDDESDGTPPPKKTPKFQFQFGAGLNLGFTRGKQPMFNFQQQNTPKQIDNTYMLLSASGKTLPKKKIGLDLTLKDKNKSNILHYLVKPNGWENITLLQQLIKSEPTLKRLIVEANSNKETPVELAKNLKQFLIFKELNSHSNEKNNVGTLEWTAGTPPAICQYDVEKDSKEFLEAQAKKMSDAIAKKKKDPKKPNKHSGYRETGQIVESHGRLYKILMHKTDIMYGHTGFHNFYRMELINRRGSDLYILFTNWGRIGESVGQYQRTPFGSLADAEKEFYSIFKQKSGNEWENIENFEEKPNKYRLVSIDENSVDNITELDIKLKFHDEEKHKYTEKMTEEDDLYCFIKDISNVKRMQEKSKTLCQYSPVNAPFGKFNRDDLIEAKRILNELNNLYQDLSKLRNAKDGVSSERLLGIFKRQAEYTNSFYRHMPLGGFENSNLPILDDEHKIKEFDKMIEQMLEFEIAGKMVTAAAHKQEKIDPYRYILSAIETNLSLLNPDSLEAQHILQYIQNSSTVKVSGIFAVTSRNSVELFKESGVKLYNHRYLWHGTKPENLLSILKLGLLATPPSAIACGQAFGEGIYFADVFQKSHSYCTNSADGFKYMLLCEVALGDIQSESAFNVFLRPDDDLKKLKKFNTLKILGRMRPNPIYDKTLSTGVVMPVGSLISTNNITVGKKEIYAYNEYSEYIVKDQRNTIVRYLVRFQ